MTGALLLTCVTPTLAQVDWSGGNAPENGATVEANQPVVFRYQIYDAGRTEPLGRGAGLGAALFYRDAATQGAFTTVPMEYSTQGGIGGHDDVFTATVPFTAFGGAASVEYFSVAYDSLVQPVMADTTEQDVHGNPPNYVFGFGIATMPNNSYVHMSVCLNGIAAGTLEIYLNFDGGPNWYGVELIRPAADQLPDLWEGDFWLSAGVLQTLSYYYVADGQRELDEGLLPIDRQLVMVPGQFLQGHGTDSWGNTPLGCHLTETVDQPVRVHFSVCMGTTSYTGGVCVSGDRPELGEWGPGVALTSLQGATNPDLYEGDVLFPAGSPAVVRYKYRDNECADWEDPWGGSHQVTNRALVIGGRSAVYVAPTEVWANAGPNICGPPTGVAPRTWTDVKSLYR